MIDPSDPAAGPDGAGQGGGAAGPEAAIVEAIRAAGAEARIVSMEGLASLFPGTDVAALLAAAPETPDIESIPGVATTYWFSTRGMTRAYAVHLARIEDNDPPRLVAETVREESRLYPRATALERFADHPFRLSRSDLADILESLGTRPETADIRSCRTSDDSVFLFSTLYLSEEHAQGLAEWEAVGSKENP